MTTDLAPHLGALQAIAKRYAGEPDMHDATRLLQFAAGDELGLDVAFADAEALTEVARLHTNGNGADSADAETWPLLRDLLDRPDLLAPPVPVVPRLAFRGRAVLLVGGDKAGKSTLAAHASARLSRGGWWLGAQVQKGNAIVCAPDEALGDTVRRLHELDANPDRIRLLSVRPPNLLASLNEMLDRWRADLVVVDSLAEWARIAEGRAPDDGDAAGWGAVIRPLIQVVTRDHDAALLLLHHPRRSDDQYRGSLEIAAAVDGLWEMTRGNAGEDPTLRRFRGRARWPVEDWSVRLTEDGYELGTGGPLTLDARILADTGANAGASRAAQHERLGGRKATYLKEVSRLIEAGALRDMNGKLYLPNDVSGELL